MKTTFPLTILLFLTSVFAAVGQNSEKEILKKLAAQETEAFQKREIDVWKTLFIQDDQTQVSYVGNGYYVNHEGWSSIDSMISAIVFIGPQYSTVISHKYRHVQIDNALASMRYEYESRPENDTIPPTVTQEFLTFKKLDGQWKITSIVFLNKSSYSYGTRPEVIENRFNETGYSFLEEKKINEAIEVFKLNVKLYPDAWNTYDSLGEAYAAAGNKELAIANYQKSVELNPENENGKEWLKKLNE